MFSRHNNLTGFIWMWKEDISVQNRLYTYTMCIHFQISFTKIVQYYNCYLKLWTHNVGMKTKYMYIRWAAIIEFDFIYLTMYCMIFKEVSYCWKTYIRKSKHSLGNVCQAINIAQLRQNMVLSPVNNLSSLLDDITCSTSAEL